MDTQHAYALLNTTMYSVLDTALYTVLYNKLYLDVLVTGWADLYQEEQTIPAFFKLYLPL